MVVQSPLVNKIWTSAVKFAPWQISLQWIKYLIKFSGGLSEKFNFKNWEGRPRILDHEIGSHPADSIKKACHNTQHYSEISLGAKLIVV